MPFVSIHVSKYRLILLMTLFVTASACRPTLYNSDIKSVEPTNDSTVADVSIVATSVPNVEASASPTPSPSESSSSSSNAASKLTVSGPSSQLMGACCAFTMTASNAAGTTTGVSEVTSVSLAGGSTSVFSTNNKCSTTTTSLTLTRLESSQVFYHRSTDTGTVTITPTASGFTGSSLATSMSSGSWSTQALLTTTSPGGGLPFSSYFGGEFWVHYLDTSSAVSMHRTLNGSWSDPFTIQTGLTNSTRPVVKTSEYGFVFVYAASDVADTGTAGQYGHYYEPTTGYSTQNHFDTTSSAVSKGVPSDPNASGNFVVAWIEGLTAYASIFNKASGTFSTAVNLNTGTAPNMMQSVIYDDGTAIVFAYVSNLLKYAYFNGTSWQPIVSMAENCGAMSVVKKDGSNSHLVCDAGGVLKETAHTAGLTSVAALNTISGASTAGNWSNAIASRLSVNTDGTLTLLYVNAAATENYVMTTNPDHTWNAPTSLVGSAGGLISINLLSADYQGNMFAMFDQAGHVYAARYVAGLGWSSPSRIDNLSAIASNMTIAADPFGYAVLTWKQSDTNAQTQFYYSLFQ